jgi:hypothetical protein
VTRTVPVYLTTELPPAFAKATAGPPDASVRAELPNYDHFEAGHVAELFEIDDPVRQFAAVQPH